MNTKTVVDPAPTLLREIYVPDLAESITFWKSLNFHITHEERSFAVLQCDTSHLYLRQSPSSFQCLVGSPIKVTVADVNALYRKAVHELNYKVLTDIGDRGNGIRDFTIQGPAEVSVRISGKTS
jgi:catechol 2,3-dioxygenase-like lactoylglutathione lyase family enzyme